MVEGFPAGKFRFIIVTERRGSDIS